MLHRLAVTLAPAATALVALAAPALAVTDWSQYKSFAKTRCEAPKTIADMAEAARGFPVFREISDLRVISVRTVRATASVLACRVTIHVIYRATPETVSGTFTVHLFPNGKWNDSFDETY